MSGLNAMRSLLHKMLCFVGAQHDAAGSVGFPESVDGSTAEHPGHVRNRYLVSLLMVMLCSIPISCDLPHQPGPMPTDIVATEYEAGLNILGVLRADDQSGTSFINVNRSLTTEEIYSDSIEAFSPETDHVKVKATGSGAEYLFIRGEDSSDWGDYRDTTLSVAAGVAYDLEIRAPGFPTLTGQTMVPRKPQLVASSLLMHSGEVSFQIQHHASAHEYNLYLFFDETVLETVVKVSEDSIIDVQWEFDDDSGRPSYLGLTALDENLTHYGNTPISFMPNTYHADPSTVSGGYGCFGSVSVSIIEL